MRISEMLNKTLIVALFPLLVGSGPAVAFDLPMFIPFDADVHEGTRRPLGIQPFGRFPPSLTIQWEGRLGKAYSLGVDTWYDHPRGWWNIFSTVETVCDTTPCEYAGSVNYEQDKKYRWHVQERFGLKLKSRARFLWFD